MNRNSCIVMPVIVVLFSLDISLSFLHLFFFFCFYLSPFPHCSPIHTCPSHGLFRLVDSRKVRHHVFNKRLPQPMTNGPNVFSQELQHTVDKMAQDFTNGKPGALIVPARQTRCLSAHPGHQPCVTWSQSAANKAYSKSATQSAAAFLLCSPNGYSESLCISF